MSRAAAQFGFVLAGGNAIAAHGIGVRPSEDIDLFTNRTDADSFDRAVSVVTAELGAQGWVTDTVTAAKCFAQIVASRGDQSVAIDMGVDFRARPPAVLAVGPVLALDDAAGSKMATLYSRGFARDYIDVHALLTSGRFSLTRLMELGDGIEAQPLDRGLLARRFADVDQIPIREFLRYGLDAADIARLQHEFRSMAQQATQRTGGGRLLPETPGPSSLGV